jgi:hypothetical protein
MAAQSATIGAASHSSGSCTPVAAAVGSAQAEGQGTAVPGESDYALEHSVCASVQQGMLRRLCRDLPRLQRAAALNLTSVCM